MITRSSKSVHKEHSSYAAPNVGYRLLRGTPNRHHVFFYSQRITFHPQKLKIQSSVEQSVVVSKPSWTLVSLKILLSLNVLQMCRISSISKSFTMIELAMSMFTVAFLDEFSEGFLGAIWVPKLCTLPVAAPDTDKLLSLFTDCALLLCGKVWG